MRTIFNITSFVRFLSRNKLFTAVNIFGFAISLAFVVLLGLYIQKETSINASNPNKERIYRITTGIGGYFAAPIAADLKNRYPEIEATLRTYYQFPTISDGLEKEISGEMLMVDSSFLTMFEIPFIEGSAAGAMRTKDDILLSEKCALQLFGDESAMGKMVMVRGQVKELQMVVSGVFRDLEHSHFKTPDVIGRFENVTAFNSFQNLLTGYENSSFGLYVMTQANVELTQDKVDEMKEFIWGFSPFYKTFSIKELFAEPLMDVYYTETRLNSDMRGTNDMTFLSMLVGMVLLVLFFAVINYINLSVAQAGFRAKEASMRRLLGGSKGVLFLGFIIESFIVATVSLFFGVMFAGLIEPWFQQVMWTDISVNDAFTLTNIALALGGLVIISVISGLVPATVLTRFKPIDVVRGTFKRKTNMVYSKVLIVFQYCITIVLLVSTITIMRQLDFMKNSDLGFNKDNILVIDVNRAHRGSSDAIRSALSSIAGVKAVGFSNNGSPVTQSNLRGFNLNGKKHSLSFMEMDSIAFNIFNFTPIHHTGVVTSNAFWLNKAAWNDLELADDVTEFRMGDNRPINPIAGMLKDYHVKTMDQPIGPSAISVKNSEIFANNAWVQISGTDQFEVADKVKEAYLNYTKEPEISAKFMDEYIQQRYASQERMSWIIGVISMLAVLISALGMLAMATYFTRQRAQEIAVRKVFGASGGEVMSLLMMNFLKLVLIAFVIAVPIGWYFMRDWLNTYVYRVDLSWSIFAIAGVSVLLVASGTILWQSLRATHANPVKSIRD